MRRFAPYAVPVLLLVFVLAAAAEEAPPPERYPVVFEPGQPGGKLEPRFSPSGTKILLEPLLEHDLEGLDPLVGRIPLGPSPHREVGHLLVVARSAAGKPYDLLWIDLDGDGVIEAETPLRATPLPRRSGGISTTFQAELSVDYAGVDEEPSREPYRISLWLTAKTESGTPGLIRFTRKGYRAGQVTIASVQYDVVLADNRNDAIYGVSDDWTIRPATEKGPYLEATRRDVGDFAWAGDGAWKLELVGVAGRAGHVVAFDPGLTLEEDARARDRFWDDKHAVRAATPVLFSRDVEKALAEAAERKAPVLLDFDTEWCTYCKYMDRWVYTAKTVATASQGVVCIKVDADLHEELAARHAVESYPTGVLLDPEGKEIGRFQGYQTVVAMTAFFAKATPWLGDGPPQND